MRKLVLAAAVAGMFALVAQAEGTAKTLADVGTTGIAGEPNVALIDRGAIKTEYAGTYALVFSNAQTTTFTFNSPWAVKEFLVVGGGGAGGGNVGAGGGGGGVIYFTESLLAADVAAEADKGNNVQTNFENGQSISLTIGAGGKGGFKKQGTPGGHSTLTLGTKIYTAYGGAGGGDGENTTQNFAVAPTDGNTGCGAGKYNNQSSDANKTSMSVMSGDAYGTNGYYGTGGGNSSGTGRCGGGGGAGAAGGNATSSISGNGGDGLPCSITGTEVYYAAGGGGGDNLYQNDKGHYVRSKHATGGKGGGGAASMNEGRSSPEDATLAPEYANATGYGCGGGGGCGGAGSTDVGGSGSAGIVVLLIEPVEIVAEKPVVSMLVSEQGANYAKFSVSVVADGLDNTTASAVWGGWAKEGDAITCAKLADAVAVNGSVAKTVTGLEVGATYAYKFYAVNENSVEGDAVTGTIALNAGDVDPESADPVITCDACTVIGTSVNIPYCVAWPGMGKEACSVTLKYGLMSDKLSYSVDLGSGLIGNNSTQVTGLIPGRKHFFQLTADNGSAQAFSSVFTATIADGETFPTAFDARQPVIAGVGAYDEKFICGGDGVIYRGFFANYVEDTEVTFHYEKEGVWKKSAAVVTADGFTVTVENDLAVSTDYPFYFTATAGGFADCTLERSFNSKGAAILNNYLENGTQEQSDSGTRIFYLQGNNPDIGCGTNTVLYLLARKRVNNAVVGDWFVLSSRKLAAPIGSSFYKISDEDSKKLEFGASYDLRFRLVNSSFGGQTWTIEYENLYKTTGVASDNSTYTWRGTDGLWNDPLNWSPDPARRDGTAGYPVYGSTAKFADNAVATVRVERAERAKSFLVGNSSNVTLSFNVPQDGLADAMVKIDNAAFPNNPVTIAVDPNSGFYRRPRGGQSAADQRFEWAGQGQCQCFPDPQGCLHLQ